MAPFQTRMTFDPNELTSCLQGSRPFRYISFYPPDVLRRMEISSPFCRWISWRYSQAQGHTAGKMAKPRVQFKMPKFWLFLSQPWATLWVACSFVPQHEICGSPGGMFSQAARLDDDPPQSHTALPLSQNGFPWRVFFFKARNSRKISPLLLLVFPL